MFLFPLLMLPVKSFSCVPVSVTPWTSACQATLSMGFSRWEHWRGHHQGCRQVQPTEFSALGVFSWLMAAFSRAVLELSFQITYYWKNIHHVIYVCVRLGHCHWSPPFSLQCVSSQRRNREFRRTQGPRRRKTWAFLLPHGQRGGKSKALVTVPVCESVLVCVLCLRVCCRGAVHSVFVCICVCICVCVLFVCMWMLCVYLCIDQYMCVFLVCYVCLCHMYVYMCICMFVSICMMVCVVFLCMGCCEYMCVSGLCVLWLCLYAVYVCSYVCE